MKNRVTIFLIYLLFIRCNTAPPGENNVATIEQVNSVLRKDLLVFNSPAMPEQVYESISHYKAIIVGEFHTILEEREFVSSLSIKLNELKENTDVCAECPDAYSWIFEGICTGELEHLPEGIEYKKIMPVLDSLSFFNSKHNTKAKLNCIDANLQSHFFLNSLKAFAEYLSDSTDLFFIYDSLRNTTPSNYKQILNRFISLLTNTPDDLGLPASGIQTEQFLRMFKNELISADIRERWDSDYSWSVKERETLIKSNAEYYLSKNNGTTVFYFGLNHAQKRGFMGSNIEWLGEYLHDKSPAVSGNTISIVGVPLKGEIINESGKGTFQFDLTTRSESNDLFRLAGELTGENYAWLYLSDNMFSEKNIRVKYIYDEYEITNPIGQQFDAFYIFPVGTFVDW
jgi:hypothetical protein